MAIAEAEPYVPPQYLNVIEGEGVVRIVPYVVKEGEVEFMTMSAALKKLVGRRTSRTVGAICDYITRIVDAEASKELEYLQ